MTQPTTTATTTGGWLPTGDAVVTQRRQELAADLDVTGLEVHCAWPDRLSPPCVVLVPGSPWVDSVDLNFGEVRVRIEAHIIAAVGATDSSLTVLEDALEAVLVNTVDWALETVDAPSLAKVGGAEYLGTTLTLSQPYRLPEPVL